MITIATNSNASITLLELGPLANIATAYREHLVAHGYAQSSQHHYVSSITHLGHGMCVKDVSLDQVSPDFVSHFVEEHLPTCTCPGRVQRHPPQVRAALQQLLIVLHDAGFTWSISPPDKVEVELDDFDSYLRDQRGLALST